MERAIGGGGRALRLPDGVAVLEQVERLVEGQGLSLIEVPGGLYAVTRAQAESGTAIVTAWNRLISEWLPRSAFELGDHGYIEEFQQSRGQITRMKLYLPVKRSRETETIEIVERPKVRVVSFEARGPECITRVDAESVVWLQRSGFAGDGRLQVFRSGGFPPGDCESQEIYISLPEGHVPSPEDVKPNPYRIEPPDSYRPVAVPKVFKLISGGRVMSDQKQVNVSSTNASPIKNKVGNLFIPVRDIERSRSWYCQVLGLNETACEIHHGHLCPLPMEGTGIILDTMPMWGGDNPEGAPAIETPAFMLMTEDLQGSLDYMKQLGVELVTEIEHDHWFVVKDPDGNKLMICRE